MTNQASFGRRGVAAEPPRRRLQTELAGPVEVVITRRGPSKWKIAGYVLGGLFVLGVIGNLIDPDQPTKDMGPTVAAASPAKASAPKKCGATLKEFSALQIGTSPATAARIIGCPGEEMSRVGFGGQQSVLLSWQGEAFLSSMNATFSDGRMTTKSQFGLE